MNSPIPTPRFALRSVPAGVYVFLAVFALRLLVLARLTDSPFLLPAQGDMHFYNEWAQRILRGEFTDHQAFYGLPLYAFLLAGLYKVFGFSPFVPGFVQAGLDAGTAVILFALGRRVFGTNGSTPGHHANALPAAASVTSRFRGTVIGLIAASGWAFFLPAQSYSIILMPTAWLVFVFWIVIWGVVRHSTAPKPFWFLLQGVLIGFTAMGVATILFLVPLLLAAAILKSHSELGAPRWRHAAAAAVLLLAGIIVGTAPAWIHNYFIARDRVFLSAHSGVNLWIGNNPAATGYPRFPLGLRAGQQAMLQDSIAGAEAAAGRPLKRSEISKFWSSKAKDYISTNPGAWLKLIAQKIANFWNSFQYDDLSIITSLREQGVTLAGLRFGIVAAFGLTGIALAWPRFRASRWIAAAILLHMVALLSVFITERYRLAAVPGLLLFGGFAVWHLWETVAEGEHKRAVAVVGLLFISATVVSARRGDAELWALEPYNSGLQALDSNRLDDAQRKLQLAYAYVPDNAELNFALGNLHLARRQHAAAKAFYLKTRELDPLHKGSLNNLGVIALDEKQPRAAIALFEAALEIAPDDPKSHYLLARANFEAGDVERALAALETALRLKPEQAEFLQLREQILAGRAPNL